MIFLSWAPPGYGKTFHIVYQLVSRLSEFGAERVYSNIRDLKVESQEVEVFDLEQPIRDFVLGNRCLAFFSREKSRSVRRPFVFRELCFFSHTELNVQQLLPFFYCFVEPGNALFILDEVQSLYPSSSKRIMNLSLKDLFLCFPRGGNAHLYSSSTTEDDPSVPGVLVSLFDILRTHFYLSLAAEYASLTEDELWKRVNSETPATTSLFFEKHRHFLFNFFCSCQNSKQVNPDFLKCCEEVIRVSNLRQLGARWLFTFMRYKPDRSYLGMYFKYFSGATRRRIFSAYCSKAFSGGTELRNSSLGNVKFLATLFVFSVALLFVVYIFVFKGGTLNLVGILSTPPASSSQPSSAKLLPSQLPLAPAKILPDKRQLFMERVSNMRVYFSGYAIVGETYFLKMFFEDQSSFMELNYQELQAMGLRVRVFSSCLASLSYADKTVFASCPPPQMKQGEEQEEQGGFDVSRLRDSFLSKD